MTSLRTRLLLGTMAAVAAVLGLAGWSLHTLMERSLVGELDRALVDEARLLASTIDQEGTEVEIEFDELDMTEFQAEVRGGFLEVAMGSDALLHRSPSLDEASSRLPRGAGELSGYWLALPTGAPGRAVTYTFEPRLDSARRDAPRVALTLVLARDASRIRDDLSTLAGLLGLVGLATLAASAAVLLVVVTRSLRPAEAVAARIAGIGEDDLSVRLPTADVPSELLPIVERVNGLLARLDAAFSRERAFSSDVAHELRTPLAGLRTTLEVDDPETAARNGLAMVTDLESMVARLLELTRLDGVTAAREVTDVDVCELVTEAWEPFVRAAEARDLDTQFDLPDGGVHVATDPVLLGVVVRNVFENAATYADTGGSVRIAASPAPPTLRVSNTGSALTPAQAARTTERFWRGDSARTAAAQRSGLGLAIAARAMRVLGGALAVRSRTGGEFEVTLTLPAAAPAAAPASPRTEPATT